jgi:ribosomal protein L21
MKSKKGYRKSQGHRQKLHKIQIEKIEIKASAKVKETE